MFQKSLKIFKLYKILSKILKEKSKEYLGNKELQRIRGYINKTIYIITKEKQFYIQKNGRFYS